ncbi:adenylate/guanylate cyclase domain-containing protein [Methylobacterium planeticum]|uniref:Adenylate/guanylate cyclase domain-containing protein n=2 Tax=Methylobacterium planeticum TaxID=2615211 RepID=A0A6N6MQE8_9HYPH|nr:adenylate/guanylate cyclase domain-containing protein [Methylobacterium planeticum]
MVALQVVIVLVLFMTAQVYDGSLHALSHWFILASYAAGVVSVALAEREPGRRSVALAWGETGLNAGLAVYVIVEHMLAGAGAVDDASDAVSQLPAFLLLLQTGLRMRVLHTMLFAGVVTVAWGGAILIGLVHPEGFLGPQITLSDQVPGLLTFAAASLVVIDGVRRLRSAVTAALRLEHERTLLARFVPGSVAVDLAREGGIGAVRHRHACLMAVDIRGFSALTRERPQEEVVRALLDVRALVHAAVTGHGGIVDKYVGDGVLAQFVVGTPAGQARAALACAGTIHDRLADLNRERRGSRLPVLRVMVALHAGEVLVGVFDDGLRAEFTVLGPAMNTLARIESRTKAADLALAASGDFVRLLTADPQIRFAPVESGEAAPGVPSLFSIEAGASI